MGIIAQVPVLLAMGVVTVWAMLRGFPWSAVNAGIKEGIDKGIVPIFIFILIGAMISTWIAPATKAGFRFMVTPMPKKAIPTVDVT
ncbi:hypothetical protein WP50_09895, partial [Lactiplantibacillus plantarum]